MSEFGGQAVEALQQMIVRDHPSADAGAHSQVQHIRVSVGRAEFPFAECGQARIVAQKCRHMEIGGQFGRQRKVVPLRDVGRREHAAGVWIQRPRRRHPDRQHFALFGHTVWIAVRRRSYAPGSSARVSARWCAIGCGLSAS